MEILIKAGQLILSLSILIVLHELGHFLPARLFKIRVEKFYLFFDWKFSLFKYKKGDTEYGIGWIPLGGYVKIAGMIDESMDKEQMEKEPEEWEFRSKPAWQRLIIMVGGVVVNLIVAFVIYSMVLFTWGSEQLPVKNLDYGMAFHNILKEQGLKNGDVISKIGDEPISYVNDVNKALLISDYSSITVLRNGKEKVFPIEEGFKDQLIEQGNKVQFAGAFVPYIIDTVIADMPAALAGVTKGDTLKAINGVYDYSAIEVLEKLATTGDTAVNLLFKTASGEAKSLDITSNADGKFGVQAVHPFKLLKVETKEYGFFESFPAGLNMAATTLGNYVKSMKLLGSKSGLKQMGGFASIGSLFAPTWDWESFWRLTALISVILAFMNILPIPALDGGHVMFLLYEMITGRKPHEKVMEYAQMAGMIFILLLLVYANGMDIVKFLF